MGLGGPLQKFSLSFLHKCVIRILFNIDLTINIETFTITVIMIVLIIEVLLIYYYENASILQSANCQFSTTSMLLQSLIFSSKGVSL